MKLTSRQILALAIPVTVTPELDTYPDPLVQPIGPMWSSILSIDIVDGKYEWHASVAYFGSADVSEHTIRVGGRLPGMLAVKVWPKKMRRFALRAMRDMLVDVGANKHIVEHYNSLSLRADLTERELELVAK